MDRYIGLMLSNPQTPPRTCMDTKEINFNNKNDVFI